MKKEVSCRALLILFEGARRKSIPVEKLCDGVTYPLSVLRDPHERVEWDVFRRIAANLTRFVADDEFEALGFQAVRLGSIFPAAVVAARFLFNCKDVYYWTNTDIKGPGAQMFTCIEASIQQLGANHLAITLIVSPGHEYCREFFLMTKGAERATPTIIGLPPAIVEMKQIQRGAIYDVVYPEGGGALSWVRKAVIWPFAAPKIARELKNANEVLHERYSQLEEAQSKIQHQAVQLQTAFSISEVIRKNLNLDATVEAVAQSLVDVAHFAAAEVCLDANFEGDNVSRDVIKGAAPPSPPNFIKNLEVHGQPIGTIQIWLPPGTAPKEAEELLDQVAPSIAMEIDDAISFTLLNEYRNRDRLRQREFSREQFESQEAERKRIASELHDGLGQDLLVVNNELQQFLNHNDQPHEELRRVAELVQGSIEGVREISSNLHPHHLDRLGLCAAIEAMADAVRHSSGLNIDLSCDKIDGIFPKEIEIHVYRIIQEALSNVIRHARATKAAISARNVSGGIEIEVSDNGMGFVIPSGTATSVLQTPGEPLHGFGLSSMRARARIIGGTLTVDSKPGSGTRVTLTVPHS